jgi:hypothetical protein
MGWNRQTGKNSSQRICARWLGSRLQLIQFANFIAQIPNVRRNGQWSAVSINIGLQPVTQRVEAAVEKASSK